MKNWTKRFIACICLAAAIVTMLLATGCKNQDSGKKNNDTSGSDEYEDHLLKRDMEGFTLTFLNYTDSAHDYSLKTIDAEDYIGDAISDKIYERNRAIEARYNAKIKEMQVDKVPDTFNKTILTGEHVFDVAMVYDAHVIQLLAANNLAYWDLFEYIDFDAEWWNQDANECFQLHGKQYAASGDLCLSMHSKSYVYYFNKDMYATISGAENLYQLVREGKWTVDKMMEITRQFYLDINNNGSADAEDQFGVAGTTKVHFQNILTGAGVKLVDIDEDGEPYFALPGNNYAIDVIMKLVNLHQNNSAYLNNNKDANGGIINTEFNAGRVLMLASTIWNYGDYRDLDFSVGILPSPKFSESQEDYYSITVGGVVSVLPTTLMEDRAENVGILLEAMSFYSHKNILPIYKEVILQARYADAPDDSDMVDLVFRTQTYDLGVLVWGNNIRKPLMTQIFHSLSTNVSSFLASIQPVINATIQATIRAIE